MKELFLEQKMTKLFASTFYNKIHINLKELLLVWI